MKRMDSLSKTELFEILVGLTDPHKQYMDKINYNILWHKKILELAYRHKVYNNILNTIDDSIHVVVDDPKLKMATSGVNKIKLKALLERKCYHRSVNLRLDYSSMILRIMHSAGLNPVIVKGIPLSKIIYDDIYFRQHEDIDVLVSKKDQIVACKCMESLGFIDQYAYSLKTNIDYPDIESTYYNCCWEKEFSLVERNIVVAAEIKNIRTRLPSTMCREYFEHIVNMDINGFNITTFDEQYSYLYLIQTAYDNFTHRSSVGIDNTLRDLRDIYCFTDKIYKKINIFYLSRKYEMLKELSTMLLLTEMVYPKINLHNICSISGECYDDVFEKVRNQTAKMLFNMKTNRNIIQQNLKLNNKNLRCIGAEEYNDFWGTKAYFDIVLEQTSHLIDTLSYGIRLGVVYSVENISYYFGIDKKYKKLYIKMSIIPIEGDTDEVIIKYTHTDTVFIKNEIGFELDDIANEYTDNSAVLHLIQRNKYPNKVYYLYLYISVFLDEDFMNMNSHKVATLGSETSPVKLKIGSY